jgi:ribosome biogenesis protein SSF1/2
MFAPINVHAVKLKQCNRVVLFDRNPESNVISVRHFRIVLNPVGISKSVKRVAQKRKLKLSDYKDVSDYVLSQVKASESDAEDDSEAQVAVEEEVRGMLGSRSGGKEKSKQPRQAAIRLIEIGPRIEMTLAKIYAGFMEGEVMWHWKGLDLARLNQQRKRIAQLGDKKVGEFPGVQQVLKREREEAEAEREQAQEEQEAEQREIEARKAKRKPAVGFKKKTKK